MGRVDFSNPDEVRSFPNGQWEIVHVGPTAFARGKFEPGWRWSTDVKPIAGTDSCQFRHVGVGVSGRLMVKMENGEEFEVSGGAPYVIEPGHDAWVLGDEPVEMYEFATKSAEEYAKQ